jgi:hypothetical protein
VVDNRAARGLWNIIARKLQNKQILIDIHRHRQDMRTEERADSDRRLRDEDRQRRRGFWIDNRNSEGMRALIGRGPMTSVELNKYPPKLIHLRSSTYIQPYFVPVHRPSLL